MEKDLVMKVKCFVNQRDFSCNVFVCSDDKGAFIVDLGYYDSEIKKYLSALPELKFVLQTHGHFDHIMGLDSFSKDFPDVPVYIHEQEVDVALNPINNGSMGMLYSPVSPQITFKTLKEGMCRLCDYDFKVIHTPGHTKGSCMFFFKDQKILFTGDTIIETSIGRTDLPTGDEAALFRSLEKFKKISFDDDVEVYFGHGTSFSYKELMKHNSFLR